VCAERPRQGSSNLDAVLTDLQGRVATFAPGTLVGVGVYLPDRSGLASAASGVSHRTTYRHCREGSGRVGEAAGAAEAVAPSPEARNLTPA